MIKNHKPGDVFYHEPTNQWVRVVTKPTRCRSCVFVDGDDCAAYGCKAVVCMKYGYVKAKRPKNTKSQVTICAESTWGRKGGPSELTRPRDDVADSFGYAFWRHADKATIGDAAGLKSAKKDTAAHTEHKPIEPTKCWIVCLFFGGNLLPSAMPKQHKSFESAARESQRLAELHNKTFIVLSALSATKKITMPVVVSL